MLPLDANRLQSSLRPAEKDKRNHGYEIIGVSIEEIQPSRPCFPYHLDTAAPSRDTSLNSSREAMHLMKQSMPDSGTDNRKTGKNIVSAEECMTVSIVKPTTPASFKARSYMTPSKIGRLSGT